jgi:hypothetical protein
MFVGCVVGQLVRKKNELKITNRWTSLVAVVQAILPLLFDVVQIQS